MLTVDSLKQLKDAAEEHRRRALEVIQQDNGTIAMLDLLISKAEEEEICDGCDNN
jgi:hypothetical protein